MAGEGMTSLELSRAIRKIADELWALTHRVDGREVAITLKYFAGLLPGASSAAA